VLDVRRQISGLLKFCYRFVSETHPKHFTHLHPRQNFYIFDIYLFLKQFMSTNANNIENFPIERLNKSWPFSLKLAEDLFFNACRVDSLKDFFIYMEFG